MVIKIDNGREGMSSYNFTDWTCILVRLVVDVFEDEPACDDRAVGKIAIGYETRSYEEGRWE